MMQRQTEFAYPCLTYDALGLDQKHGFRHIQLMIRPTLWSHNFALDPL